MKIDRNTIAAAAGSAALLLISMRTSEAAPPKKSTDPKTAVVAVVNQFEQAYKRKDKQTMLMRLMIPATGDARAQEKRYQWLRGYGPHDLPGTKHPPILFETSKGSFVPSSFRVTQATPDDATHWTVSVRENGTYRDEDGRYAVERVRFFKIRQFKGKWWVEDYVLKENPDDYGFYVDDISDKTTPLGK